MTDYINCGQPNCSNPAEFIFEEDSISKSNKFCLEHIGEHLHYCHPDVDKHKAFAMKRVTVEFLD